MEQRIVRRLERELEEAIADVVIVRNGSWKYPLLPSRHTLQMMAKAAAAVYEVAAERHETEEKEDPDEQRPEA